MGLSADLAREGDPDEALGPVVRLEAQRTAVHDPQVAAQLAFVLRGQAHGRAVAGVVEVQSRDPGDEVRVARPQVRRQEQHAVVVQPRVRPDAQRAGVEAVRAVRIDDPDRGAQIRDRAGLHRRSQCGDPAVLRPRLVHIAWQAEDLGRRRQRDVACGRCGRLVLERHPQQPRGAVEGVAQPVRLVLGRRDPARGLGLGTHVRIRAVPAGFRVAGDDERVVTVEDGVQDSQRLVRHRAGQTAAEARPQLRGPVTGRTQERPDPFRLHEAAVRGARREPAHGPGTRQRHRVEAGRVGVRRQVGSGDLDDDCVLEQQRAPHRVERGDEVPGISHQYPTPRPRGRAPGRGPAAAPSSARRSAGSSRPRRSAGRRAGAGARRCPRPRPPPGSSPG